MQLYCRGVCAQRFIWHAKQRSFNALRTGLPRIQRLGLLCCHRKHCSSCMFERVFLTEVAQAPTNDDKGEHGREHNRGTCRHS